MIGLTATTGTPRARAAASSSAMPGTARIGPIETIGFEGPITMTSAAWIAAATAGGRPGGLDAVEADLADVGRLAQSDEVVLEVEPAVVGADLGAHRLVGHRQDRRRDAAGALQVEHRSVSVAPGPQPRAARDVGREVVVAEAEPRLLAVLGQGVDDGPGLAGHAPAALVVERAGEHVEDRVVVGHHEQAVPFDVVAGVDDDRRVAIGECQLEPVRQLRATGPAGEDDDLHAPSRAPTSAIRSMVSRSYGAGIRTMTVRKPSSWYGRSASATWPGEPSSGIARMSSMPFAAWSSASRASAAAAVSRRMIGKLIVSSIVETSRPTASPCSPRISSSALHLLDRARGVPGVRPFARRSGASSSARSRR